MTHALAFHGGTPVIDLPLPHVPWPLVDDVTIAAVTTQLLTATSIPDRSGVIADLEDRLAEYFGVRYAVLASSGTAALHSAYAALGLGDGDEVIVPAYTFHATATPLFHLRARPVLVDCDLLGNIDPKMVEAAITPATKAIVVTHMWGVPAQLERLVAIADSHGLDLVEDGSHAHGATYDGRKVGSFGKAAAFSMNGPKPLSAGEGGFVLTDDEETYYRTLLHGQYNKRCRTEIPKDHPLSAYAVTGMGLKLRIHPLAAALASDQLDHLDARLVGRRRIADRMLADLRDVPGLGIPEVPDGIEPSWYALALTLDVAEIGVDPGIALRALHAEGLLEIDQPGSTRPMNEHALFSRPEGLFPQVGGDWPRYREGQFPNAERLHRTTVKFPVPHDDGPVADGYVRGITKVLTHAHLLQEDL
ncbi:DegT/DnrJ/EryC1/StrS family aminotransferase [Promicromonospora panici]|uniref:DegT/DnrJ/EryC1/StrS family aminotransferase n=1 Tax=Promicromonospora panici TaxID=2219658 RepID=UPI00101C0622|nr:DegT/DnrJ/EryC1/StrS family aminotransferase [Promicromonospora panici]